jgi:hypothetical protein
MKNIFNCGRLAGINRLSGILLLVCLQAAALFCTSCEPEPEPEPFTTKFEGTWQSTKPGSNNRYTFTGNRYILEQEAGSSGVFDNDMMGTFRFDDEVIRLEADAVWSLGRKTWEPIPVKSPFGFVQLSEYKLGDTLKLSASKFNGSIAVHYDGDYIKK